MGPRDKSEPQLVPFFMDKPVRMVSCGWEHTCACTFGDGLTFSWGNGQDGRLGNDE